LASNRSGTEHSTPPRGTADDHHRGSDLGGGQVIVVDPDNAGLVSWYAANGFLSIGAPDLRMRLKLATARTYLR
jgi:hypothetical protein